MAVTRKFSAKELPDPSVIGVFSDVHIPNHDEPVVKLMVEVCEAAGVTHVVLDGDIADCGPASRHDGKKKRAVLDEGCLRESIASGLWFYEWARTKRCKYILGNHEAWVQTYIDQSPELKGTDAIELMGLWPTDKKWEVLPQHSRIRVGDLTIEHGDAFFKTGSGGNNPGARIKQRAPDQSTLIGHLHRDFELYWTTLDADGILRVRVAAGQGHLSIPETHEDYMGGYIDWQQSISLVYVWYDGQRPRFTIEKVQVHRDKRGRPIIYHNGKVYR